MKNQRIETNTTLRSQRAKRWIVVAVGVVVIALAVLLLTGARGAT